MPTYRIADCSIGISSLYPQVQALCRDYRADGIPDFTISMTREDLDAERLRVRQETAGSIQGGHSRFDSYLEELAVYRKIAEKMPEYDTFLMHASAIAVDGEAFLFTAPSGTGKSTHVRLWRELLGERAVMINDDKPLLRVADGKATVFGSPWNGKHRLGTNTSAPVRAICFLERSTENRIREVPPAEIYPGLLAQTYRPENAEALLRTLKLLKRLQQCVRFYRLGCNMNPDAAVLSYQRMKSG